MNLFLHKKIQRMLSRVNSAESSCSNPTDWNNIRQEISNKVSFQKVDSMLSEKCRLGFVEILLKLIDDNRQIHGELHQHTIVRMKQLAGLYYSFGKYADAEPYYVLCLSKLKRIGREERMRKMGRHDRDILDCMNDLAVIYGSMRKHEEAESLYRECLEQSNELPATKSRTRLQSRTMNNLGELYLSQKNYPEAEKLLSDAFALSENELGPNDTDTLSVMHNLARLHKAKHDYSEAQSLFLSCLKKRQELLGEDDRATLTTMFSLARLYKEQEKFMEAEKLLESCVDKAVRVLGRDHPLTDTFNTSLSRIRAPARLQQAN